MWSHCRGTVILGFEQANRYTVLDQEGNVVALLAEDLGGLGKAVGRQLLRTRRAFTATVFSPDGESRTLLKCPPYEACAREWNRSYHVLTGKTLQPKWRVQSATYVCTSVWRGIMVDFCVYSVL